MYMSDYKFNKLQTPDVCILSLSQTNTSLDSCVHTNISNAHTKVSHAHEIFIYLFFIHVPVGLNRSKEVSSTSVSFTLKLS